MRNVNARRGTPEIIYVRVGQVERVGRRGYEWRNGYSENGDTYPWLTRREAQQDARNRGAKAVFVESAPPVGYFPPGHPKATPGFQEAPVQHQVADFNVIRRDWGGERVIATYHSRAEAERDAQERNDGAMERFRTGQIHYDVPEFYVISAEGQLEEAHVVADFNTLDDLIAHAESDLGATHVIVAGPETRIFFPRGGQYQYEAARVWRRGGYWHAEGPGSREGVTRLPREAETIGSYLAGFRPGHAAEATFELPHPALIEAFAADVDALRSERRITYDQAYDSIAKPGWWREYQSHATHDQMIQLDNVVLNKAKSIGRARGPVLRDRRRR